MIGNHDELSAFNAQQNIETSTYANVNRRVCLNLRHYNALQSTEAIRSQERTYIYIYLCIQMELILYSKISEKQTSKS